MSEITNYETRDCKYIGIGYYHGLWKSTGNVWKEGTTDESDS